MLIWVDIQGLLPTVYIPNPSFLSLSDQTASWTAEIYFYLKLNQRGNCIFCPSTIFPSLMCSLPIYPSSCCLLQRDPQQCHLIISLYLIWRIQSKLTVISPCLPVQPHLSALPSWHLDWSKTKILAAIWTCYVQQASVLYACTPSTLMVSHCNPTSRVSLAVPTLWSFNSSLKLGYSLLYVLTIPYVHLLLLSHGVLEGNNLRSLAKERNNIGLKFFKIQYKKLEGDKVSNIF